MCLLQGVKNLKDMGFAEEDVIKALKATGNNQRAAVSFFVVYPDALIIL